MLFWGVQSTTFEQVAPQNRPLKWQSIGQNSQTSTGYQDTNRTVRGKDTTSVAKTNRNNRVESNQSDRKTDRRMDTDVPRQSAKTGSLKRRATFYLMFMLFSFNSITAFLNSDAAASESGGNNSWMIQLNAFYLTKQSPQIIDQIQGRREPVYGQWKSCRISYYSF